MQHFTTVIVGAGHCGLAMSRELSKRSVDHVVLEKGRIGNSWHTERWDSLHLLTPNWMSGPAGHPYDGPDPDGFMSGLNFADRLERAAALNGAPVMTETRVLSLDRLGGAYRVQTDRSVMLCGNVVIATGDCAIPKVPRFADAVPAGVAQLTPRTYKRPSDLPDGSVLVVGASASGLQIARELNASGRQVTLAVGNHLRLPRRYRGRDILWWMHRIGVLDVPYTRADDLDGLRRNPSLPLSGDASLADLDLSSLQEVGIEIVGRLASIHDGTAWFSGSLANVCASADLKLRRLLDRIDAFAEYRRIATEPPCRPPATRVPETPRLALRLGGGGISSVIWATGYQPDHHWVNLPVFDGKGRIRHVGGVVGDGLYVMGLKYLRTARSTHISGAVRDARALARHLTSRPAMRVAA